MPVALARYFRPASFHERLGSGPSPLVRTTAEGA
jgi:hypothetical protein